MNDLITSNEQLQQKYNEAQNLKFIFFWGHQKKNNETTKSCFSQWYESEFVVNGIKYQTAEQFMMAEKARLFNDYETLDLILNSKNPGEVKKFGRLVKNFSDKEWQDKRFEIVVEGNLNKFSQNQELKEFLINTNERIIVEASPLDKIWGIGMAENDEGIENPFNWKGLNLLGYALMVVREKLKQD